MSSPPEKKLAVSLADIRIDPAEQEKYEGAYRRDERIAANSPPAVQGDRTNEQG
jgi:hypothetical protein